MTTPLENDSSDYVIIGGGSAGCVMASRLSEDVGTQVTLLEAGGSGNGWVVNTPAAGVLMLPTRLNNWAFDTVPQKGLNGRIGYQPRGKALGGSSAINAMIYTRGHRLDYDHWAALGNPGWAFDDVLPYFKRSEHNEQFGGPWHGQDGPLDVAALRSDNPFQQIYLEAARQAGFRINDDFNGADQEGAGLYQVTQRNGERCSAARAYLQPHIGRRGNLRVETHAQVERIVFDGRRAIGVVFRQGNVERTVLARREVILCAGALKSPQLLMVSGVGEAGQLQRHGIDVVHHLPGVGANLQDHPDFIFNFKSGSLDLLGVSVGGGWRLLVALRQYLGRRRGLLTTNFAEGGAFLKTSDTLAAPDVQLHFVIGIVDNHARKQHLGHGFSCHVCLLRPKSRGSVTLASARSTDAPLIDPAFFQHDDDIEVLVKGFKLTRRLLAAPALARWQTRDMVTADVHTDDDIRHVLRAQCDTAYHPVGTCRMGPGEDAVVDASLRVHGIGGLRVVDASIMPTLIGGNTNAPTLMIAEKAADLIREGR